MFNAKTVDGFLTKEQAKYVVNLISSTDAWESNPGNEFWDKRVMNVHTVKNSFEPGLFLLLEDATNRIKHFIESEYNLSQEVYPDVSTICRWFPGMEQSPHADDMTNTEVKGLEHRIFGSIIYLNTEYTGGKTYYPNYNQEITPEVGKLAVHPGDVDHLHGVTKIESGIRYTIAAFWSHDKGKAIDWSLYK